MMGPFYIALARILITTGWVSLADYCLMRGLVSMTEEHEANLRIAMHHIRKTFQGCGLSEPHTEKIGVMIYSCPPIPKDHVVDTLQARELAGQAKDTVDTGGSLKKAAELLQQAREFDPNDAYVRQAQQHLLLADATSSTKQLLEIAHINSLRRIDLRGWLETIDKMLNSAAWKKYWDRLRIRQQEYQQEYAALLMLRFRTTLRVNSETEEGRVEAELAWLAELGVRAHREPARYRQLFQDAVAGYSGLPRLVTPIVSFLQHTVRFSSQVQLSPEDGFRIVGRVVCQYMINEITLERFTPRTLESYIRKACLRPCKIEWIAEMAAQSRADVEQVFQKWEAERAFKQKHNCAPTDEELRSRLRLSDETYQRVLDVEAALKAIVRPTILETLGTNDDEPDQEPELPISGQTHAGNPTTIMLQALRKRTAGRILALFEDWADAKRESRDQAQELTAEQIRAEIGATPEEYELLHAFIKEVTAIIGDQHMNPEDLI